MLTKDRDAMKLWDQLKVIIPRFFDGLEVKPSLLHGDLWSGNAGTVNGKPGKYGSLLKGSTSLGIQSLQI